jgi:flagellin-like hook-associated protein FlgL
MVMSHNATRQSVDTAATFREEGRILLVGTGENPNSREAAVAALADLSDTLAAMGRPESGLMGEKPDQALSAARLRLENRRAAASRAEDADVALAMSEFVRGRILSQAPLSGLSQADRLSLRLMR